MSILSVDIASKVYPARGSAPSHTAIGDLRFDQPAGQFLCITGPSGCGKTTLLHLLAGLDLNFEGSIVWKPGIPAPLRTGYVFQEPRLLPWRTVLQNIELVLGPEPNRETIETLLHTMGLEPVSQQYPQKLSLGMCRRVALARAFAIEPDLLLMDEPFVSLDAPTARRIRNLLIEVWRQRPHTVIFVTHDLREAITLGDRLLFLSAAPSRIIGDIPVPIPRGERGDEEAVETFRRQLLGDYPEIRKLL